MLAARILAKRSSSITLKRLVTPQKSCTTTLWKGLSTATQGKVKERVPPEDYYEGHLMADHLEYIDDMIEKMVDIEKTMNDLKKTHKKKKEAMKSVQSNEVENLFEQSLTEKEKLSGHIDELKGLLAKARNHGFAVDGPDGMPDGYEQELQEEVNHIVDDAALHEDKDAVNYRHKMEHAVHKDRARDPEHDW